MKNVNTKHIRKHMSSPIHPPSTSTIDMTTSNISLLRNAEDFRSFLLSNEPCGYYHDKQGNIIYSYTCLNQWVTCLASYSQESKTLHVIDIASLDEYLSKLGVTGVSTC